jgi:hypothetical protein
VIAQVAAQLAQDRGNREGAERGAAIRVVAVDRLDERQAGDLEQVVERLGRVREAHRHAAGERLESRRQPLTVGLLAPRA